MKKITAIFMSLILTMSICSCGASGSNSGAQAAGSDGTESILISGAKSESDMVANTSVVEEKEVEDTAEEENVAPESEKPEEDELQEDMDELAAIGDVEVENGILTVSITVPADLVGETTQESLDASKGENYLSAVLNEDGSVTYKMTKAQHRAMLESIAVSIDDSIQTMIDDNETYTITSVEHNDTFTEYDVTLEGTEIGFGDMFTSYTFFIAGHLYGIFSGHADEKMVVNFYDPDGNLIDSYDSDELQDAGEAGDTSTSTD